MDTQTAPDTTETPPETPNPKQEPDPRLQAALKEIAIRFTYHAPKGDQAERYHQLRETARAFANVIVLLTPESREQSLAITHLETAVFYANAAIARRE